MTKATFPKDSSQDRDPDPLHSCRILVIGNYALDHQQSMIRFASLLCRIYANVGVATLSSPPALVARLPGLSPSIRKYLAYIDKLFLFPLWLIITARAFDFVHIADHSNAFYSFCYPRRKTIVTCHDLLAVRGALGDASASCSASPIGIWLQRLIMAGLRRASAVAFDSQATFDDFRLLIGSPPRQRHAVIPIPLNAPFSPDASAFPLSHEEEAQLPQRPFLLMVGSALPRKNRTLALHLLEFLGASSDYQVVFAGAPLSRTEESFRDTHPLGARIHSITSPSHALLNRLYCEAHALLFPSFAEGFGWPIVEAQTCHCPVIASPTTSIPEVAGDGALFAQPTDVATFALHVFTLENPIQRRQLIQLGLANTRRFAFETVGEAYRRFAFVS